MPTFSKERRLRRREQFRELSRYGQERRGRFLFVKILCKKEAPAKLGLTVPKRFGKAWQRNLFKRRVREAFRLSSDRIPPDLHLNISPHSSAERASFREIQDELIYLIESTD